MVFNDFSDARMHMYFIGLCLSFLKERVSEEIPAPVNSKATIKSFGTLLLWVKPHIYVYVSIDVNS